MSLEAAAGHPKPSPDDRRRVAVVAARGMNSDVWALPPFIIDAAPAHRQPLPRQQRSTRANMKAGVDPGFDRRRPCRQMRGRPTRGLALRAGPCNPAGEHGRRSRVACARSAYTHDLGADRPATSARAAGFTRLRLRGPWPDRPVSALAVPTSPPVSKQRSDCTSQPCVPRASEGAWRSSLLS